MQALSSIYLRRVPEAGEVAQRCDTAGGIGIEKAGWNGAGAVDDELEVCRVEVTFVDLGNGVEVALSKGESVVVVGGFAAGRASELRATDGLD